MNGSRQLQVSGLGKSGSEANRSMSFNADLVSQRT